MENNAFLTVCGRVLYKINTQLHLFYSIRGISVLRQYCADLHIHVGWAQGLPVKITASKKMTLAAILEHGVRVKGLQIMGVVDCGSPLVLRDIKELLDQEKLFLTRNGDLITERGAMLLLGVEVESREGIHFISYLPNLQSVEAWQKVMQKKITNPNLSTQRCSLAATELIDATTVLGGIFVVAYAFTPIVVLTVRGSACQMVWMNVHNKLKLWNSDSLPIRTWRGLLKRLGCFPFYPILMRTPCPI